MKNNMKGGTTNMKGKTLATLALGAATFLGSGCSKESHEEHVRYTGKSDGYSVRIETGGKDNQYEILAHLENGTDSALPLAVTGHDYDGNGTWDKILIESDSGAYNAVNFQDGKQMWEPSNTDKDRVSRFTQGQLMQTRTLLDKAVREVGNEEHKVR